MTSNLDNIPLGEWLAEAIGETGRRRRMNWIIRYWNYLKTWRAHRDTIKKLNQLSDNELKDIGITRGDIDRLVWLEEDKSMRGRG